ncbi:ABC transporter ATP-binding protein [Melghirimyces profundicolus]|nr:ATP-binding cassette domain-containing protein [Melghirimyces profundicolus]
MIEVQDLTKEFKVYRTKPGALGSLLSLFSGEHRRIRAVDGISFSVKKGECIGFIGPNGAGKSTTIKMLSGILHPSRGRVSVMGASPQHRRKYVAQNLGIVFGQRTQLWWDLPLRDSYEILRKMYRLEEKAYHRFLHRYHDLLSIGDFLETPVRKLSLGQRMRADLAAALIHDPPILFLDEPTIGLDVMAKESIRSFLREINREEKKTILLTTHDMDDIERLAARVVMINHGRIILDGCLETLRERIGLPSMIEVHYREVPRLARLDRVERVKAEGKNVTVHYDRNRISPPALLAELNRWGEPVDIRTKEPEIEEVIRRLYGEQADPRSKTAPAR